MTVRPIVALDVGATKVACAIGLPHEQSAGFELMGSSVIPYPTPTEGWLADPLLVGRTIEQALDATAVSGEMNQAIVSISPPSLSSEQVRATITLADEPVTIRQRDLARLQITALNQILSIDREPLLIERLSCTGNGFEDVRNPAGLTATRLIGNFHILTMPMAARRAAIQAVEAAGLDVERLVYTLPPVLRSMFQEGMEQQRILLIEVGGMTTSIGLFVHGGLAASRILPIGGMSFARHIATELQVTSDQALTWTLEGASCSKPAVRTLISESWESMGQAITETLQGQPRPEAVMLSGRGALIDGFAEWVERTVGMESVLCRSPRTSRLGELARQVGLNAAIGILEIASQNSFTTPTSRTARMVERVIGHTKTVLTEYF